jgi:hypothetical protein
MRVSVDAGLLNVIMSALLRDRDEGKVIRGEMVEELRSSVQPLTDEKDAYVSRRIKQERTSRAALDASNALQELAGAYNRRINNPIRLTPEQIKRAALADNPLKAVELDVLRANGFVVTPDAVSYKPFGANRAKYQKRPFSSVQADIQDGVLEEAVRLFQGRLTISDYRQAAHRRDAFFGPFCECTRRADR